MSNLLSFYLNSCGLEKPENAPDFPAVFTSVPEGDYVTISTGAAAAANVYDFYNDVFDLVDAKLVQIGSSNDYRVRKADDRRGLSLREEAHLIANAKLHVGNDHVFHHVAASKSVPSVALYSTIPAVCLTPLWGNCVALEPIRSGKPTYADEESPKTINSIMPETVAEAIHLLIGGRYSPIVTKRIGSQYTFERIDLVPDFQIPHSVFNGRRIVCRFDLCPNEPNLAHSLSCYPCGIITEDPISIGILQQFKPRIQQVIYNVDKNLDLGFVSALHYSGIPYELVTEQTGAELADLKLKLFDFNQVKGRGIVSINGFDKSMKFKTNRMFLSRNKFYPTIWHLNEGKQGDTLEGLESRAFQESWEHLYIYESDSK